MPNQPPNVDLTLRTATAGVLSWLLPGWGHWYLGQRGLGVIFFCAITAAYWIGVALGGVKYSVNWQENGWLFLAELCAGGYTMLATLWGTMIHHTPDQIALYKGFYPAADVAQIYLSTAGLLNIMVILDAAARAHKGLPTYQRELLAKEAAAPAATAEKPA